MVATTRNRPKALNVSKTALDQAGSFLQDLSAKPKEEMSIREAIDQLRDPIQNALAKGYNYEDIVGILVNKGITTTAATVKRYVSLGSTRKRKSGTRAKRKSASTTESVVEASAPKSKPRTTKAVPEQPATPTKSKGRRQSAAASTEPPQTTVKTAAKTGKSSPAKPASRTTSKSPTKGRKKA
jgi:hypothetical protein